MTASSEDLARVCHVHSTLSETVQEVALAFRRADIARMTAAK